MATTPERVPLGGSELSNESPLPTPPKATHDDIRTSRPGPSRQGRASGSHSGGSSGEHSREHVHAGTHVGQSRGDRQASHSGSPAQARPNTTPPGSLAASLGASSRASPRTALGAQLGIVGGHNSDERRSSAGVPLRSRPALQDVAKRSVSYESSRADHIDDVRKSPHVEATGGVRPAWTDRRSVEEKENHRGCDGAVARSPRQQSIRSPEPGAGARTHGDALIAPSSEHKSNSPRQDDRIALPDSHANATVPESSASQPVQTSSNYQTPSLSSAARGLRSGQGMRHVAAPWSVGRSIKRIDRNTALDRPPQRIVAPQEDVDDEEDEPDEAPLRAPGQVNEDVNADDGAGCDGGKSSGSLSKRTQSAHLQLDPRMEAFRYRTQDPVRVPRGADEDEEELDGPRARDLQSSRPSEPPSQQSSDIAGSRRRTALQDILGARVASSSSAAPSRLPPLYAPKHNDQERRQEANVTPSNPSYEASAASSLSDFLALVRREAMQQEGLPFIENIKSKPSKDMETKFNGLKFKKVRKAGEGGFSTVWVVRGPFAVPDASQASGYADIPETEQAYFAMKQVTLKKMEQVSRDEVLEECNTLQSLASKPNNEDFILRFFGWKGSTGSLKILIELGELDFSHILRSQRLSRTQIVTYWYQMLQAVHFTHEEGNIVHTDLKPANFLMASGRLKLIDFGIAQKIPVGTIHIKRDAMIGTPNYMAPETVRAVKEARIHGLAPTAAPTSEEPGVAKTVRVYKAGKASDVWALGCILYQMVYSRPPFDGYHGDDKLRQILNPQHRIEFGETRYGPSRMQDHSASDGSDDEGVLESVDAHLLDAMRLTLTYGAAERITIPQLFEHPLLRPLEQQRRAELRRRMHPLDADASIVNGNGEHTPDHETVRMTRDELKDIVRKMYAYARNGELREDNLDARSDALFDNICSRQQQASAAA